MKIVDKTKFIRTMSILLGIITVLIFSTNTYSKGKITYKEYYIYEGDTLWSIAKEEIQNNEYFRDKDIREVTDELKKINNLSNSNLYCGDKIKIPKYE